MTAGPWWLAGAVALLALLTAILWLERVWR